MEKIKLEKQQEAGDNKRIGTDIDGVIAFSTQNKKNYTPYRLGEYYKTCRKTGNAGNHYDFIISGRREKFRDITEQWLRDNGISFDKLILFPSKIDKTNQTLSEYKAKHINGEGLKEYREDDPKIAKYLQDHCPNCKIKRVDDLELFVVDPELDHLFPDLAHKERVKLQKSIEKYGIRDAICIAPDGTILDGMQRYRIARDIHIPDKNIPHKVYEFENRLEMLNFAISANLDRRQVNPYQRARAALLTEDYYRKQAKIRMSEGGKGGVVDAQLGKARDIMAKVAGVGNKTLDSVKYIEKYGSEQEKKDGLMSKKSIEYLYHRIFTRTNAKSESLRKKCEKTKMQNKDVRKILKSNVPEAVQKKMIEHTFSPNEVDLVAQQKAEDKQLQTVEEILKEREAEKNTPIKSPENTTSEQQQEELKRKEENLELEPEPPSIQQDITDLRSLEHRFNRWNVEDASSLAKEQYDEIIDILERIRNKITSLLNHNESTEGTNDTENH
jgi:hypothetical protein